jgi:hypothetical protein
MAGMMVRLKPDPTYDSVRGVRLRADRSEL